MSVLIVSSCSEEDLIYAPHIELPVYPNENSSGEDILCHDTLRILDIGNSYSRDGVRFLNSIVEDLGADVSHVAYYSMERGSASFFTWYRCYYGKDDQKFEVTHVMGDLPMDVPIGTFRAYDSHTFRDILSVPWDIIVLHQVSQYATDVNDWNGFSTSGYLPQLLALLKELQPSAVFAFTLVHSYSASYSYNKEHSTYLHWQSICQSIGSLEDTYPVFQIVIPYGTAIERLRAEMPAVTGDLTRDGTHLGFGLPMYTASLCYFETLLSQRTHRHVSDCSFLYQCTENELNSSLYPASCIDITPETAVMAKRAAQAACNDYTSIY